MRILIKVGGTLLDDAAGRRAMAQMLAGVAGQHDLVVVHGGGKQMTRFLAERGIESRFTGGLRVSDEAVIDAVLKVIAGTVNKQLVGALAGAGQRALGLSGLDGGLTSAVRLDAELGFVGKPVHSNGGLLRLLIGGGYLPVVACVAGDAEGTIYNVNADQMAVSCASAFSAEKLLFLTDVAGVRGASGEVLPHLTAGEIRELIARGIAHGGMQAKLEAATAALDGGTEEVIIASGTEPGVCGRVLAGELVGTKVCRAATGNGRAA